ncbi:DUF3892 domain-containing protein [Knoellia flava]|uniref:DUF3892 domain-containing protein n=1 Tax=Knoellia flava TaxID=913969 RepID=A0A8H9KTX4_9MICO|nr:DUF3892 domain-containing protein [Knoellia flava]GGB90104.1 hypothetical protein GCM10011314_32460 [Knoellia flava]
MAIRFTHIHLSGGTQHQHITHLWWVNPGTGATGDNTRAALVAWIEQGNAAFVGTGADRVQVGVVDPPSGPKYLRTYADRQWTNNLLALPRK